MTLQDLIIAVEGADGRLDDETLGRVICAVEGVKFDRSEIWCGDDGSDELNVFGGKCIVWRSYRHLAPDVSIDAALALIERKLPDAVCGIENIGRVAPAEARVITEYSEDEVLTQYEAVAKTAPLALCAALLRALQSQAQENRKDVS